MLCDRTWRSTRHSPLERSLCGERSAPRGGLVVVAAVVAAAAVEVAAVAELLEEEVQELARLDGCPPRKGGPRPRKGGNSNSRSGGPPEFRILPEGGLPAVVTAFITL